MGKEGDRTYFQNIGESGRQQAFDKPFSEDDCPDHLSELGQIFNFLGAPPAKILDLGCGTGWTSEFLAKRGFNVIGQDLAKEAIDLANQRTGKYPLAALNFICSDYESLDFKEEFDFAIFYDSLHHAENEFQALQKAYNSLKKGGKLITSEPGFGHGESEAALNAVAQYGVTEKSMSPYKIKKMAKKIGFSKIKSYPHHRHITKLAYSAVIRGKRFGWLKSLLLFLPVRWVILGFVLSIYHHFDGICVLKK